MRCRLEIVGLMSRMRTVLGDQACGSRVMLQMLRWRQTVLSSSCIWLVLCNKQTVSQKGRVEMEGARDGRPTQSCCGRDQ